MSCLVNGYIAELVFPVPIVPVIKKFWYNPFSGRYISLFDCLSNPIKRLIFLSSFFIMSVFLVSFLYLFSSLYMLLLITTKEKINVIIYSFFIYSQRSGFSWQISKGLNPYSIITSFAVNKGLKIFEITMHEINNVIDKKAI